MIVYSEKIATGDNIEDSTFMFECLLSENARFISFFTHDSDLNELRDCLTAIRGSYSVGDIENAFVEVLRLKEKLFQMKSAMVPSVENIM